MVASTTDAPAKPLDSPCTRRFKLLVVGSAHIGKGALVRQLATEPGVRVLRASQERFDGDDCAEADGADGDLEQIAKSFDTCDVANVSLVVPFAAAATPRKTSDETAKSAAPDVVEQSALVDVSIVSPSPATRSAFSGMYRGAAAAIFVVDQSLASSVEEADQYASDVCCALGANECMQYVAVTTTSGGANPPAVTDAEIEALACSLPGLGGIIDARLASKGEPCTVAMPAVATASADAATTYEQVLRGIASAVVHRARQGLPILCNPVGPGREGDLSVGESKQGCCMCLW